MTQFCIFSLVLTAIHLRAKLGVSSFYRSGDIRGSQNSISWSLDPTLPLLSQFWIIFVRLTAIQLCVWSIVVFHQCSLLSVSVANLEYLALFVPDILGCPKKNPKSGSREPHVTPFDRFCVYSLVLNTVHTRAKFEVSSFIFPKIPKVDHLTLTRHPLT